jgi:hypothetical protein
MDSQLLTEKQDLIAYITIHYPEKRNALRDFPLTKLRDIHENRLPMQEFFLKIRWF